MSSFRHARPSRPVRRLAAVGVLALALGACGNGDEEPDAGAGASDSLEVEAGDLYFEPETLTAPAGEVEITLVNVGTAEHDFVIEELDDEEVVHADAGETASGTVTLEAGTYTFYCSIPGHRSQMEGTLTVE